MPTVVTTLADRLIMLGGDGRLRRELLRAGPTDRRALARVLGTDLIDGDELERQPAPTVAIAWAGVVAFLQSHEQVRAITSTFTRSIVLRDLAVATAGLVGAALGTRVIAGPAWQDETGHAFPDLDGYLGCIQALLTIEEHKRAMKGALVAYGICLGSEVLAALDHPVAGRCDDEWLAYTAALDRYVIALDDLPSPCQGALS